MGCQGGKQTEDPSSVRPRQKRAVALACAFREPISTSLYRHDKQKKSQHMTTERQKDEERLWVQDASTRLGADWHIEQEREAPDFIINDGTSQFGLEICAVHIDDLLDNSNGRSGGSSARRQEGEKQKKNRQAAAGI
jgi:hypothetical protein